MSLAGSPQGDNAGRRRGAIHRYVEQRPLLHFVVSEAQAGAAAYSVYLMFVFLSYLTEKTGEHFHLQDPGPAKLLEVILAWAGAISGSVTFSTITFWSVVRLWTRYAKESRP